MAGSIIRPPVFLRGHALKVIPQPACFGLAGGQLLPQLDHFHLQLAVLLLYRLLLLFCFFLLVASAFQLRLQPSHFLQGFIPLRLCFGHRCFRLCLYGYQLLVRQPGSRLPELRPHAIRHRLQFAGHIQHYRRGGLAALPPLPQHRADGGEAATAQELPHRGHGGLLAVPLQRFRCLNNVVSGDRHACLLRWLYTDLYNFVCNVCCIIHTLHTIYRKSASGFDGLL